MILDIRSLHAWVKALFGGNAPCAGGPLDTPGQDARTSHRTERDRRTR